MHERKEGIRDLRVRDQKSEVRKSELKILGINE